MDIFKRLETIRRRILITSLAAAIFLVATLLSLVFVEDTVFRASLAVSCTTLFLLSLVGISYSTSAYKQLYGRQMLRTVMESLFDRVSYEPDRALPPSLVENTDMIAMGNSYESSEYREGEYRGIRFTMADVHLKNVLCQGKQIARVTYFSGTWMIFDFEKAFRAPIQVKEKSFMNAQKPRGDNPDLNRVWVEDEAFARFFKVYAEDGDRAAALLSSPVREAILSLNYELRGDLMFYFNGKRLHIALHGNRARYEPPMLGRLYREEVEKVLLADCRAVSAFLDRLLSIDTIFEDGSAVTEG